MGEFFEGYTFRDYDLSDAYSYYTPNFDIEFGEIYHYEPLKQETKSWVSWDSIADIFKAGLSAAGKTVSDIYKTRYFTDYKTVPGTQTGIKVIPEDRYPVYRKRQTGVDTGKEFYVEEKVLEKEKEKEIISGLPNWLLFIAIGFVLLGKK